MNLSIPEPAPKTNGGPEIWDLVIEDMKARDNFGFRKYGVHLHGNNGRNALCDAYQEALDLAVYLRQEIWLRAQAVTLQVVTFSYEACVNPEMDHVLVVCECPICNGLFGIDATFLDQDGPYVVCPMCLVPICIEEYSDGLERCEETVLDTRCARGGSAQEPRDVSVP